MTVERTHGGHLTRYALHDDGALVCELTFGGPTREQASWKILLPGPDGTEGVYAAERLLTPGGEQLRAWLAPIVGAGHAPPSPPPWMPNRRTIPAGSRNPKLGTIVRPSIVHRMQVIAGGAAHGHGHRAG